MISIIIPAYNSESFIKRALDSVHSQLYSDYEIIVVNDGSTDSTAQIVRSDFPEVKLINKKNSGPSSARNEGIRNANGEYIAFLDADDYWLPNKLKKQLNAFQKNNHINIVSSNMYSVKGDKIINVRFNPKKIFLNDQKEGIVENFIRNSPKYTFYTTSTLMVKTKIFERYGLFDEDRVAVEESEIVLRWIMNSEKIYFINEPLVCYETANKDSLTKNVKNWSENHFKYWIDYLHKFKGRSDYSLFFKMAKKTLLYSCTKTLLLAGHNRHAKNLLFKYKSDLFSLLWFYALIMTYLPLHKFKRVYKLFIK